MDRKTPVAIIYWTKTKQLSYCNSHITRSLTITINNQFNIAMQGTKISDICTSTSAISYMKTFKTQRQQTFMTDSVANFKNV